jgi:hypothetical protein
MGCSWSAAVLTIVCLRIMVRIQPPEGRGGVGPGSGAEEAQGLLRLMFLIGLDPVLQGWWLSRLINTLRLGFIQRQRMDQLLVLFFSYGVGCVFLVVAAAVICITTIICIMFVLCCLYAYQICIIMLMNTSNV